ncbi:hypothetical protein BDA96_05G100800 [Sorghum bicolor]|uniref:Protein kinase domain-containing protein n=1 Tax=Sorghum bicolor TaxID=4558 RepID=A0A921QWH4_SORBI|nr:hypothetical protein BDA96_05G100800 [Sorghum bicolor]
MPPPRRLHLHLHAAFFLFLLPAFFLLLATRGSGAAASALSTFALAKADATTIVCALLPSAASPLLVDLNCTAAGGDHERQETYPSSHPFAALAGGEDFLCAVGPSGERAGDVDMRWWDLSGNGNGSRSKRVYMGPPLRALSSGGYRVCGVLDSGELHCWRWRGLNISRDLRFVDAAVGDGFVCGILKGTPASIRCFGNDTAAQAVKAAPEDGSFDVVAARGHRACALSTTGALTCWGRDPPRVDDAAGTGGYAALALGETGVCGLRTNFTIRCFGDGVAHPPPGLAHAQFLDVRAHGKAFCGVLMANYSLLCWGGAEFNATNRLVFGRVMPGPCVPMSSCQCGVLPGSANLCDEGRCVCVDCAFELNVARPNASVLPGNGGGRSRRTMWIAIAAAGAAFLVFLVALQLALVLWCRRRRRRRRGNEQDASGGALQSLMPPRLGSSRSRGPGSVVEHFTLDMLHAATDGFSDDSRIGTGSFGSVYRGTLPDGREVAIKRAEESAKASSSAAARPARRRDRETAFNSELTALARANHKNIVCLLGCCADSGERVLVYEFMANGTLHDQLHSRSPMAAAVSSWRGRLTIALGAARGIEYMHVYAVPPIIHRDVKSANILLDDAWTAKIADFGLSSVLDPGGDDGAPQEPLYTGGTVGYMDPEYYRLQHLTDKSDVYSFGVVLLELMSGCRVVQRYAESVTPKNVVEFAVPHILADDVARVLDPRLPAPTPDEAEALAYVGYLAAGCVGPVGCDRPSMTEVVDALERALAACGAAPLSRAGTTGRRPAVLSRSGTDQFDLTDTD